VIIFISFNQKSQKNKFESLAWNLEGLTGVRPEVLAPPDLPVKVVDLPVKLSNSRCSSRFIPVAIIFNQKKFVKKEKL
jgi:hypothetical protein